MTGFVDLQVNGYAGIDFNADDYSDESVHDVCERLRSDGTDSILATVITAPLDRMVARVSRIASLIDAYPQVRERIGGIHVEGPFLNPAEGYIGAHPTADSMPANTDVVNRLLDAGCGHVRLWTLAPEMDDDGRATSYLTKRGVVVAAGHCDATLDQLRVSIDNGLKLFTHLGNGCPGSLPRHDNIVQRVLSLSDRLMISFIADGHHVPPFALRNYLQLVPSENVVIVTDAISAAGLGPGKYELSGQSVEVDEDGAAWAACRTHFAGCATTFPQMVDVLKQRVGVTDEQIESWMKRNPARLLKTVG
ncbi:MAG: N-acetylglucosamine-6-phosphate deacetylase [Rubripirellula sp.]